MKTPLPARLALLVTFVATACGSHQITREPDGEEVPAGVSEAPSATPPALEPAARGARPSWPGEFEPASEILMAWDENLEDFFVQMVTAAASQVPVTIILQPSESPALVNEALARRGLDATALPLRFVTLPIESIWVRDFGPLVVTVEGHGRRVVDLDYFRDSEDDVPVRLGKQWGLGVDTLPLSTEGGNLLSDGHGRCLVSDEIFEENRNDETRVRTLLREFVGCDQVFILPMLEGEPTGHVDMYATITGPGEVIVGRYDSKVDPANAWLLDWAAGFLEEGGFRVRRIPMPGNLDGIFRSYTNALALNGIVMVPVYPEDSAHENDALNVFREAYPGRRIVPIVATEVIDYAGAVHCATMSLAAH